MSTLEKAIILLKEMPEQSLETVYRFIRFMHFDQNNGNNNPNGIKGLQILQSYAGTLPADFDYKSELETLRNEKYDHFN